MELEGCKLSLKFLWSVGISIGTFITDRHRGIAKWLLSTCPNIKHYFDLWHVARTINKTLLKTSKENGCSVLKDWMASIRNHLYWCVTSTAEGFGDLIVAKWLSITRHIANKHTKHPSTLFKRCTHGKVGKRKWISNLNITMQLNLCVHMFSIGTYAHEKLTKVVQRTGLLNDIRRLSKEDQTSALEGFHSTLNQWHPKMLCFSWMGTYCRYLFIC